MRRFLSSTTALSVALAYASPMPITAQVLTPEGFVVASDGTVLCEPTVDTPCDPTSFVDAARAIDEAVAAAAQAEAAAAAAAAAVKAEADAAAAAAQAEADAAAAAAAAAQAEADAAAAAAVAAAQAESDAAVASAAAAQAEADAAAASVAAQAEADAAAAATAAQAEADAAAAASAAQAEAAAAAAAAQAEADAATAAQAEADAAAAASAQAEVEAGVAQAEADAAAAAVKAEADAAAANQAEAQAAAQAEADAAAAAQVEADAAAAAQVEADAAAAQVEADAAAAAQVEADAAAEERVEADAAAAAQVEADAAAAAQAAADAAAAAAAADVAVEPVVAPDGSVTGTADDLVVADPDPALIETPVEAPVPSEAEVETLTEILADPTVLDAVTVAAAAEAGETPVAEGTLPADVAPAADAVVTTEVLTPADSRTSEQEFSAAPVAVSDGKRSGLSNLEKVGLIALGALVVGAIINEGKKDARRVVSNTGDRVVVENPDGSYQIYKDDNAVLRQPGSTVRTETFRDGSTRTIVERVDGSQIVTIRDASGRVLRRAQYDRLGRELVLIDDLQPEVPVVITDLPPLPRDRVTIATSDANAALKAQMAALQAAKTGRSFSLRQIREIAEVRAFAATIDVDNITFDSGSAAIRAVEAENLADLGSFISEMIAVNPREMFLIEGHTDAVGSAYSNLSLSDRRAESVALALTEYFDIPPENLIVQGYGEAELRVDTLTDERLNRRVAVRIITPLMRVAAN